MKFSPSLMVGCGIWFLVGSATLMFFLGAFKEDREDEPLTRLERQTQILYLAGCVTVFVISTLLIVMGIVLGLMGVIG
jgi:hypothetical protein